MGVTAAQVLDQLDELRATVATADAVLPVGGRTHWEVGNPPTTGVEVRAPSGIVAYDPAELTVTVGAGTAVGDLAGALGEAGQECPLDPRAPAATVGGVVAAGLSGPRRLRYGPLRDRVLEVRFVTADGRLVKGGGPTVKNVTGYDVPRLLVGSLGTVGVITEVKLRCQPRPRVARWFETADDADSEAAAAGLQPVDDAPPWPAGAHRGRISVQPSRLRDLAPALDDVHGVLWLAEVGVGTVHVAADDPADLVAARAVATEHGGWLLREAGASGVDGFGGPLPNLAIVERIRAALDPTGKLSPGRLPGAPAPAAAAG